jgi:hypothetical protein
MKKENVVQVLKDNKIKFGTIKERIYDLLVEKKIPTMYGIYYDNSRRK